MNSWMEMALALVTIAARILEAAQKAQAAGISLADLAPGPSADAEMAVHKAAAEAAALAEAVN